MISVIVPIYNVENYLNRCLDSIKNQTYKDFEVLMIDDGSKDNSAEIARAYLDDPRFKYFYQHNQGLSSARNTGLDNASGEFVCFIDSDDFIELNYLETLLGSLLSNNADVAQCGMSRVQEDGKVSSMYDDRIINKTYTDISDYILTAPFSACNKLFRACLFDNLRFPVGLNFEDFATIPQIISRSKRLSSVNVSLYNYFWRSSSITNQIKIQPDILKVQHYLEETEFGKNNPDIMEIFFIRQVMGSLLWAMIQSKGYENEIKTIIGEAHRKYPQIRSKINDSNIGKLKTMWGKMLFDEHYRLAAYYSKVYTLSYNTARALHHWIKR